MAAIPTALSRVFRLLFRNIEAQDARRRRLIAIVQGAATSLGGKLIGMLVSFLSVPLTISYLGSERYGAWLTLGSLLAWLQITDLGVGNGLNTAIATAVGQDRPDLVRIHVSNAAFLLCAVGAVAGVIAVLAWPLIDWTALFGLNSAQAKAEIGPAVAAALAIFLLQFPLSLPGRIFVAMQQGRIANYWAMLGSLLSLGSLLIVTHTQGNLLSLVLAISGTWLLINVASAIWLFGFSRPDLAPRLRDVRFGNMRDLGSTGGKFFLIQVMALVTLQTDTLVISHYLGAEDVPVYSLTYNLFNYTTLPQNILYSYMWAAYSEALARGDIVWVQRTFHRILIYGMAFTAPAVLVLTLIAQPFILWWSAGHVMVPDSLVYWTALWSLTISFVGPAGCVLASAAHLKWQTAYSAATTISNLALSIILVQRWGVTGVIAGTSISYLIFSCGPTFFDAELLLRRLAQRGRSLMQPASVLPVAALKATKP